MSAQKNNLQKGYMNESQIEEQLLNEDLKGLGINEDELLRMEMQEKQNLLTALKQSASPHQMPQVKQQQRQPQQHYDNSNSTITASPASSSSSTSSSSAVHPISYSKRKQQQAMKNIEQFQPGVNQGMAVINKLSLPKSNRIENLKDVDVDSTTAPLEIALDSPEEFPSLCTNIIRNNNKISNIPILNISRNVEVEDDDIDMDDDQSDDDEECISDDDRPFKIPGYVDDNGANLTQNVRSKPTVMSRPMVDYYTRPNHRNNTKEIVKLMLKHYNVWYSAWTSLKDNRKPKQAVVLEKPLIKQFDADISTISASVCDINEDSNKEVIEKPAPICTITSKTQPSPLRKDDSIEKTFENVKVNITQKAQTMPRDSRNRLSQGHQSVTAAAAATIEVTSDEKWDPESGKWSTGRRPKNSANNRVSYNNSLLNNKPNELSKVEAKVQCPICQLDFLQSKVEGHAALCEGFPIETRSNIVPLPLPYNSSPKVAERNNRNGSSTSVASERNSSYDVMDLTENNQDDEDDENKQWKKVSSKRRGN